MKSGHKLSQVLCCFSRFYFLNFLNFFVFFQFFSLLWLFRLFSFLINFFSNFFVYCFSSFSFSFFSFFLFFSFCLSICFFLFVFFFSFCFFCFLIWFLFFFLVSFEFFFFSFFLFGLWFYSLSFFCFFRFARSNVRNVWGSSPCAAQVKKTGGQRGAHNLDPVFWCPRRDGGRAPHFVFLPPTCTALDPTATPLSRWRDTRWHMMRSFYRRCWRTSVIAERHQVSPTMIHQTRYPSHGSKRNSEKRRAWERERTRNLPDRRPSDTVSSIRTLEEGTSHASPPCEFFRPNFWPQTAARRWTPSLTSGREYLKPASVQPWRRHDTCLHFMLEVVFPSGRHAAVAVDLGRGV